MSELDALYSAAFPGQQGGPLIHVIAGKAVELRIAQTEAFRERQRRTVEGAQVVAPELLGVNRNAVPFDPRPPMVTSGLRIGTSALATRGLVAEDSAEVGGVIATALAAGDFDHVRGELAARVDAIADATRLARSSRRRRPRSPRSVDRPAALTRPAGAPCRGRGLRQSTD